jgi:hypothetical protein
MNPSQVAGADSVSDLRFAEPVTGYVEDVILPLLHGGVVADVLGTFGAPFVCRLLPAKALACY